MTAEYYVGADLCYISSIKLCILTCEFPKCVFNALRHLGAVNEVTSKFLYLDVYAFL